MWGNTMEDVKFTEAIKNGDIFTKLSAIIMGLGSIARGQIIKGLLYLGIEIGFIYYLINTGIYDLQRFISLGGDRRKKCGMKKSKFSIILSGIIQFSCFYTASSP